MGGRGGERGRHRHRWAQNGDGKATGRGRLLAPPCTPLPPNAPSALAPAARAAFTSMGVSPTCTRAAQPASRPSLLPTRAARSPRGLAAGRWSGRWSGGSGGGGGQGGRGSCGRVQAACPCAKPPSPHHKTPFPCGAGRSRAADPLAPPALPTTPPRFHTHASTMPHARQRPTTPTTRACTLTPLLLQLERRPPLVRGKAHQLPPVLPRVHRVAAAEVRAKAPEQGRREEREKA